VNRPRLHELANRLGIVPEYVDQGGRTVFTSDVTREALLSVMGFEAPTEEAAIGWLDALDHEERERLLDPVRVVERDDPSSNRVAIRLPEGVTTAEVRLTLIEESGRECSVREQLSASGTLELPTRPPYGYHRVAAEVRSPSGTWEAEQSLIAVPATCVTPAMLFGSRKLMGVVASLYSLRREHDWGIGDFGTLLSLVEWAAARGAEFVGINPLHALFNRGWDVSPYSPVSRLFRNPIYLDVEALPEMQRSSAAREILNMQATRDALAAVRAASLVDYEGVIALKHRVLRELHRTFREGGSPRQREYEEFVRARDPELSLFATWMTIAEDSGVSDWRQWPEPLRRPDSPAVEAYRAAHADHVDFHRWLQFAAEQQLAGVEARARALGLAIGVYQDLAIGTNPGGSDTWSYPELFLSGAAVGAPPDPYSSTGQNWGLPPMHPRFLRAQRYRYWIQLLRRAFEHSGALRIDHVMGLFRMFWIPDGGTGTDGAYVRFDASDLLGILALESVRHNALVERSPRAREVGAALVEGAVLGAGSRRLQGGRPLSAAVARHGEHA
jgi:4-alpha-glucanotransferase